MQQSARLLQVKFITIYEKRYLCLLPNNSAKPLESFLYLREVYWFYYCPGRIFWQVNH